MIPTLSFITGEPCIDLCYRIDNATAAPERNSAEMMRFATAVVIVGTRLAELP
jgi:hypothetical protein